MTSDAALLLSPATGTRIADGQSVASRDLEQSAPDEARCRICLKAQVAKSKPKPLRIVSRRGASGELFHEAPSALEAESELSVNLVVVLHDEDRRDAVLGNGTVSHVD